MAMNGIDISNWQNGIDLAVVPADFVICKATENTGYVSPDCVRQVEQCIRLGRLWGVYHYVGGGGVAAEAKHFVDSVKNWVGKGVLVLDWEEIGNAAWGNETYLKQLIAEVYRLSGVIPIVYSMQSRNAQVAPVAAAQNAGQWVAQYANNEPTGYQATPWNEGAYACIIRQYSSTGRLNGWGGNLDLNKAYLDAGQWMKYAAKHGSTPTAAPAAKPVDNGLAGVPVRDLAVKVMQGAYGDGDTRKAKLGSRYTEVQDFINHIATAPVATLAKETWDGKYGNGSERKAVLGSRYNEVMAAINKGTVRTHTVQSGETLSSIAAKYGIPNYMTLAQINGISNPNLIYAGQILKLN